MIFRLENNESVIVQLLQDLRINPGDFSSHQFKELLERNYALLSNCEKDSLQYNLGLSVICHVANNHPNDSLIKQLLHDCIVKSRVFQYESMIRNKDQEFSDGLEISNYDLIGESYYTTEISEVLLTKEQKILFDTFQEKRRIIVSAPTSFGKSRIIQEIIIHNSYRNILIVLPTIALLNETFVRFKENTLISNKYNLYNSLGKKKTKFPLEGNIFIFTPEKTDLLLDEHNYLSFDFFTMDEIYKIQDEGERSRVFSNCLYRLSRINGIHFYLIGPYFNGFSKRFQEISNSFFIEFSSEIVQKDDFDIDSIPYGGYFKVNGKTIRKLKSIQDNLRNIFNSVEGQTLIYRGQKKYYTESTARFLTQFSKRSVHSDLIDYISENISSSWSLVKCLKCGIAFHHGALPKYIQTEIMESFNSGELDAIVCTSTIVEGVNTTAKNVIIYDNYKGGDDLTGFDVKNIKGRAGRFLIHFIGNVYSLVKLTTEQNKETIEFSFYDKPLLDPEEAILMDKKDLSPTNLKVREKTEEYLEKLKIPLNIIRANKFISIHQQISLINALRNELFLIDEITFESSYPIKHQLDRIIRLCFEHLFNKTDRENNNYTLDELIRLTKYYVYLKPSIKELIISHEHKSDNIDTQVRNTFNLISHYFEFAFPKYFTAFENLFNFICYEKGWYDKIIDLTYLITILEFGHDQDHEIALKEAGVPNDIIKRISPVFSDCSSLEQIRTKCKLNPFLIENLTSFEKKLFNRYV